MKTDIGRLFSSEGPLPALAPGFEERPQQRAMAVAVFDALTGGRSLAVEAGTGVGKSLAYLLPGALWALGSDRRLLVSTYTRALQEQLVKRELPLAVAVLGGMGLRLDFAMLMGSDNYLCLRRLARQRRQPDLFDRRLRPTLDELADWAVEAPGGLRSTLPVLVPEGLWQRVCRDPEACMGSSCPFRGDCLYRRDWAKAESSRILVVNHALLLSSPKLPAFGGLVIDEAHSLEDAAVSHFGAAVSDLAAARTLADVSSPDSRHGLLGRLAWLDAGQRDRIGEFLSSCRAEVRGFFSDLARVHGLPEPSSAARPRGTRGEDVLARRLDPDHGLEGIPGLRPLEGLLAQACDACVDPEDASELRTLVSRLARLRGDIEACLKKADASLARWVEVADGRVVLRAAPLDLSPLLEESLFSKDAPVILTSATLSTGRGLREFKSRVGAEGARELVLDSPFDYPSQAGLLLVDDLPEPGKDPGYEAAVADACRRVVAAVPGGIFLLFSSWRVLRVVAGMLKGKVKGRPLWCQGETGNEALLEQFMSARDAVLLGVDTFWQGVDVQGGALKCVVLTKLPFPNFATPLEEARREFMESQGRGYFEDYSVPRAVVKFRQGFGRLIRSAEDRGAVVVLDSRILKRRYGSLFLDALPRCARLGSFSELKAFFRA
ncbi:MAG: ATP-dependent DNA helicase [Elusimicrobia bacterium]|nr:ATP-dependent DNA helicase [Elusimicrobiota bacterium]